MTTPIVNISGNLTIYGRISIYEFNYNTSNQTINIYISNVKYYYNQTSGLLVNSSSIEDTNETQTNSSGGYRYIVPIFFPIGTHTVIVNSTLFTSAGTNSTTFNVTFPACDKGDNLTTCEISSIKSIMGGSVLQYNNLTIKSGGALKNQTSTAHFSINASNIIIENGGRIEGNVNITAGNLTILEGGLINATSLGYAGGNAGNGNCPGGSSGSGSGGGSTGTICSAGGGGGYGSSGGTGFGDTISASGGSAYGSTFAPINYGSGGAGGVCTGANGGAGGGVVYINVTGTLNVSGSINASGSNTANTSCSGSYSGGGGSGGSVWLISNTFAGNGTISANGGNAGGSTSYGGGGGSGGRIAIYYISGSYAGLLSANGGIGRFSDGGNGTNFSASSIIVRLTLNQTTASQGVNITIYGNLSVSVYSLTSHNISIFINETQYYLNASTNSLQNTSTSNLTQTDSSGTFNYKITVPTALANYTLTVNSTLLIISGSANNTLLVADTTLPVANGALNKSINAIRKNDIINLSFNVSDNTGLSFGQVIVNDTGAIRFFNFSLTGDSDKFSQNITINCNAGCVINFTGRANDSSNNFRTNDTIITISNTPPSQPNITSPSNNTETNTLPIAINITSPADVDGDALTIYYYIDNKLNRTSSSNLSVNASEGTHNLSITLYDGADFSVNATINFTYDITPPVISIYRKDRTTNLRHIIINGTINETNTIQNVTIEINSTYITNASYNNETKVFNVTVNLTEGWNRYNVYAYDKAGNFRNSTSTEQGASVLSDTSPPTVRLITAQNGSTLANGSIISFEISDKALTAASYKVNDMDFASFNFIYDIDVKTPEWVDGANYFIVNVSDSSGASAIKNYTFGFSSSYDAFLNVSINYMNAVINDTNSTKNNLLDSTQLIFLLADSSATLSVDDYNSTIGSLGLVGNLTNAISSLQSVLSNIISANASDASNATKTENISIHLSNAKTVRNNTLGTVRVSIYDSSIEGAAAINTTSDNVTATISNNESLSASEKSAFETLTSALQSKTNITNIGAAIGIIYVNGRETNVTLFEKQINITEQEAAFYINEYIDKNIAGANSINASLYLTNKAESGTFSILVEDPIIRWSFTNTKSAVIKYTLAGSVDADGMKKSNTVITTVPSRSSSTTSASPSSSDSGSSSGGGGGGGAPVQAGDIKASSSRQIESIAPDKPAVIAVNNENIGISQISIESVKEVANAEITVSSLKSAPVEQKSAPSSAVYQYIRIDKKNIETSDIKKANIDFKVPKSWLKSNTLSKDEVALFRLSDEWKQLPTKLKNEDEVNYYFESISEGFSLFAIAKKVEKTFSASRDSISEFVEFGKEKEIRINLTNLADEKIKIKLRLEGIKGSINNDSFALEFAEKQEILLKLKPEKTGILLGKLMIISDLEEKIIPIIINAKPAAQKYDLGIEIQNNTLFAGGQLDVEIAVKGASSAPFNAVINYFIKDIDNKIEYKEVETKYIEQDMSYKSIELPEGIKPGKYALVVDIVYEGGIGSSAAFFAVMQKEFAQSTEERVRLMFMGILVLIITLLLDTLAYRLYFVHGNHEEDRISAKISINGEDMLVEKGNILYANIELIKKGEGFRKGTEQKIEFFIMDSNKKSIAKKIEKRIVLDRLRFVKRFLITQNFAAGNYMLVARVSCNNKTSISGAWFAVKNGRR